MRICHTARRSGSSLSKKAYRVSAVVDAGCVVVFVPECNAMFGISSWVRCADMAKGRP